ncbi:hypothetical protein PSHT_05594 [Puccinia striiformis]|uniref:Uncharacterized protein n=2 Tax=Puccinia striiformis TaxID=27350 RepID=A0A2S4WA50_9BASI|nr:hypothetical protein PSTT_14283 [Puccinia striiformis]POW18643.1 hypothetical protein PSHT_05594 [Puccinia striiformis]
MSATLRNTIPHYNQQDTKTLEGFEESLAVHKRVVNDLPPLPAEMGMDEWLNGSTLFHSVTLLTDIWSWEPLTRVMPQF